MKVKRARSIAKTFNRIHTKKNPTAFRNALHQTAHIHRTSERKVYCALHIMQATQGRKK